MIANFARTSRIFVACALAAVAGACYSPSSTSTPDTGNGDSKSPGPTGATVDDDGAPKGMSTGPMLPVRASALLDTLTAAGLDPANLPALDKLEKGQLEVVMKSFATSLGVECRACHAKDFGASTREKRIAAKMWDEFTRKLSFGASAPLYCDSCHQGSGTFLDRRDEKKLGSWMHTNFVNGLTRKDGAEHRCATCHGNPFVGGILDVWGAEPK